MTAPDVPTLDVTHLADTLRATVLRKVPCADPVHPQPGVASWEVCPSCDDSLVVAQEVPLLGPTDLPPIVVGEPLVAPCPRHTVTYHHPCDPLGAPPRRCENCSGSRVVPLTEPPKAALTVDLAQADDASCEDMCMERCLGPCEGRPADRRIVVVGWAYDGRLAQECRHGYGLDEWEPWFEDPECACDYWMANSRHQQRWVYRFPRWEPVKGDER